MTASIDTFGAKGTLEVGNESYEIFRLSAVPGTEKLPYALKVLAENLLRTGLSWASHSRVPEFVAQARSIRRYRSLIHNTPSTTRCQTPDRRAHRHGLLTRGGPPPLPGRN